MLLIKAFLERNKLRAVDVYSRIGMTKQTFRNREKSGWRMTMTDKEVIFSSPLNPDEDRVHKFTEVIKNG